jgi:hypothetical protein
MSELQALSTDLTQKFDKWDAGIQRLRNAAASAVTLIGSLTVYALELAVLR